MRKWPLFLGFYFLICLLAACAFREEPPQQPQTPPVEAELTEDARSLSELYLQVLEDLWNEDKGLNEGITVVGVDLTATALTEGEQAAIALRFAQRHGVDVVQGTLEELQERGYIGREEYPRWENGCLFVISETEHSDGKLRFEAWKWRSAMGAYFFSDCTAFCREDGGWEDYAVGAVAVS